MKSALLILLCFFAYSYVVLSYDRPDDGYVPPKPCANPKIQVELAGNLLEFNRDEADVYIKNPDKQDTVHKYRNVSKDCDVEHVKDVFSVSNIDLNMGIRFHIEGDSRDHMTTYEEYINEAQQYKNDNSYSTNGIQYIEKSKHDGFYILENTHEIELNNNPVLLRCLKYGCIARYKHPSGIFLDYAMRSGHKYNKIRNVILEIHKRFEQFIVTENSDQAE